MNQVAVSFPVSHGAWGTNGLSNKPSIHPSNVLLSILLRMSVSLEPLSNRILVFPGALLGISFYRVLYKCMFATFVCHLACNNSGREPVRRRCINFGPRCEEGVLPFYPSSLLPPPLGSLINSTPKLCVIRWQCGTTPITRPNGIMV